MSAIRILIQQKDTATVDRMEGALVTSTLFYANLNKETISISDIGEDPRILATSYMMYKFGKW